MGLGFGCFALLLACTRLALPRASHAGSHHIQTGVDAAFTVNPAMAAAPLNDPSRPLPKASRAGAVQMQWRHGPHGPHETHGLDGLNDHHGAIGPSPRDVAKG